MNKTIKDKIIKELNELRNIIKNQPSDLLNIKIQKRILKNIDEMTKELKNENE